MSATTTVPTAADLVRMHADAVLADKVCARATTRATVDASLAAHDRLDSACEAFRRAHYPRSARVFAVFGEVFTASPTGRRITCVYSGADS